MKIAVDLDDTLSVVDRVTRAAAYIARKNLPFRLVDENAHKLVDVFDWEMDDVLEFVREGGISVFTEAAARKGARETLSLWKERGDEVTILTAREKEWFANPEKFCRDWLEKRRVPYHVIAAEVPAPKKGEYCAEKGICVLVDDNFTSCYEAQKRGVYAVLLVGSNNYQKRGQIHFSSSNWQGISAIVEKIERVALCEEVLSMAQPAAVMEVVDGWELKSDKSPSLERNLVHPFLPSGVEFEEKIATCEEFFFSKNKPCRFRLTPLDRELSNRLAALGYYTEKRFTVMQSDVSGEQDSDVRERGRYDWKNDYRAVTGSVNEKLYESVRADKIFVTAFEDDMAVAVGMCVVIGPNAGIFDVHVKEGAEDYHKKVTQTLHALARGKGARRAYINVDTGDEAAQKSFTASGYEKIYEGSYKVKRIRTK